MSSVIHVGHSTQSSVNTFNIYYIYIDMYISKGIALMDFTNVNVARLVVTHDIARNRREKSINENLI